jgi:hypothetical protein
MANPLAGLDQLLHGSGKLHGWGTVPVIDGTLYEVRGFDPTSREFVYQVNPRFGASNPALNTVRAPFRATLDLRMELGRSEEEQRLELNMRIKPPLAGTRAPADTIKERYMRTTFIDVYRILFLFADSIALSRAQAERIQARRQVFVAQADSVYAVLGRYLAELPKSFDVHEAMKHVTATNDTERRLLADEGPFLRDLLTQGQIRLLPLWMRSLVVTPTLAGRPR